MDKFLRLIWVRHQSNLREVNTFLVYFNVSESKSKIRLALAFKVRIPKNLSKKKCWFATSVLQVAAVTEFKPESDFVVWIEEGLLFNLRA